VIEESGIVVALDGRYALVRTERRSACGGCAANGACGTSLIERVLGRRSIEVVALNQAQAGVGDRVVLGISEDGLLSASLAVYLVPLGGLVGGALAGDAVSGGLGAGHMADFAGLLGAALGLSLALWWLRGYSSGSRQRPEHQAVVVSRLDRGLPVGMLPGPRADSTPPLG
jgi:sigma-E factor negative regulatory protein RseC